MPLTSVRNPADLANVSLARIGWKGGDIGSLYEGSAAANVILDVYGQVRDALLRASDWNFAQRSGSLVLLKSMPVGGYIPGISPWDPAIYPPINWRFEYDYPEDAIKIRAVRPVPLFFPNVDPQPFTFSTANDDSYTPAREVVLCNAEAASCIYTARITDPQTWTADFTDAFADSLAESIAPGLASLDAAKLAAAETGAATSMAETQQG